MCDKWGIVITSDPPSEKSKVEIVLDAPERQCVIKFKIKNLGEEPVTFLGYEALMNLKYLTLLDTKRVTEPLTIHPGGKSHQVEAPFALRDYGCFSTLVLFNFCRDEGNRFFIEWEVVVEVRDALQKELGPSAPYKRPRAPKSKKNAIKMPAGERPKRFSGQSEVVLQQYPYPKDLKDLEKYLSKDSAPKAVAQKVERLKNILKPTSDIKKYAKRFHYLLHLEEIQLEKDIRKYDLHDQTMTWDDPKTKYLLTLQVPGVMENRPSVLQGDLVHVNITEDKRIFPGCVHAVELDRVKLRFSQELLKIFKSDLKFDVEFKLNRNLLRVQHRAVALAHKHQLGPLLFPTAAAAAADVPLPEMHSMVDCQLEKNPEQRAAVEHIVAGSSKPAPYLVFGPPGTGKTITLVEAINQICMLDSSAHILACAPTNNACDVLCDRLRPGNSSLYRMYAISRNPASIHKELWDCCNWDENKKELVYPKKEQLQEYKIIVTTLFTAGRLVSAGIPEGHFTHVFVDEAGQAPEPECVIAVAGLLSPDNGQLVLAGDPKQLGPIIYSATARHYELGVSLLERLMDSNALYQKVKESDQYDGRFITKLLRNYRSHPSILQFPNEQFYLGELQPCADRDMREAYCKWIHLPKENFPVIFHGVDGREMRESSSPSYFNPHEIGVLLKYLTYLFGKQDKRGTPRLSAKDVGIITPYRKQVEKVRRGLELCKGLRKRDDLSELKVGSVEDFQGDERRVILVSTVRSSSDHHSNVDGFLSSEKRFNVAVTRAKSLLIVVGHHRFLSNIPVWRKFLDFCMDNGGYTGFTPKDIEEEHNFMTTMMSLRKMNIDEDGEGGTGG